MALETSDSKGKIETETVRADFTHLCTLCGMFSRMWLVGVWLILLNCLFYAAHCVYEFLPYRSGSGQINEFCTAIAGHTEVLW